MAGIGHVDIENALELSSNTSKSFILGLFIVENTKVNIVDVHIVHLFGEGLCLESEMV